MDETKRALGAAHRHATRFLDEVWDRPVWPRATYAEMLAAFSAELPAEGTDPEAVVDELAALADPGLLACAGPRFFGFVFGSALPAAVATDWLVSAWDQNAGLREPTPAAAAVETVAGGWLTGLLGLPSGAAVGFVTGAMMANFSCLAAARRGVLDDAGWDLDAHGLAGAPPMRIVVGEHRHNTIDRALRLLGFGREQLVIAATDGEGRVLPEALAAVLAGLPDGPTIVCLQAGEVHTGAFDEFTDNIALAHDRGAWVHVDGAFGLWAAAADPTRHLVAGVEAADSWTTDAHKTLNVPYDCGLAIVADPAKLHAVFGTVADYLLGAGANEPFDRTPELSRRARGFVVWAALRALGRDGVAAMVTGLADRAAQLAAGLAEIDGVEVLNDVVFTQVVMALDTDERTDLLGKQLLADGTAALTPGSWQGRAVQRCSISSWATGPDDIDATIDAVRRIASSI